MATVEATTAKVQRILQDSFSDVRLANNGFAIPYESTVAFVEIREWIKDQDGNPRTVVYVWAPIGRDVQPSPELFRWAAIEGRQQLFGGVTVAEADELLLVVFDHSLLGDYLDPDELTTAVAAVVLAADDMDDIVRDRFDGKRYTDA